MRVVIPIPEKGFDPTEVAVPWRALKNRGICVVFATPKGSSGIKLFIANGCELYLCMYVCMYVL